MLSLCATTILSMLAASTLSGQVRPAAGVVHSPPETKRSQGMSNADVIKMTKAGLGDDIIVAAIKNADRRAFDASPDALIQLKMAGVSDSVIATMMGGDGSASKHSDLNPPVQSTDSGPHSAAAPKSVLIRNGTTIKVRLLKQIESNEATKGTAVAFECVDDVVVDDVIVVRRGDHATGHVVEAVPQRFRRAGQLSISIETLSAVDGSELPVKGEHSAKAGRGLITADDLTIPKGSEFVVVVSGDHPFPSSTAPTLIGSTASRSVGVAPLTEAVTDRSPVEKPVAQPSTVVNGNWKKSLEEGLRSSYSLTKTSRLERNNVTEPGTVFVVQQEGLAVDLSHDAVVFTGRVQDGVVSQRGGAAGLFSKATTKRLNVGDHVYVIGIDVSDQRIRVGMLTTQMSEIQRRGNTLQTRYVGWVDFEFYGANLATMSTEDAKAKIEAVLLPEEKATAAKTIELGQTVARVEAILGRPERIVKLGQRTVYTYKDMKVVFTDGRVSDVQ